MMPQSNNQRGVVLGPLRLWEMRASLRVAMLVTGPRRTAGRTSRAQRCTGRAPSWCGATWQAA